MEVFLILLIKVPASKSAQDVYNKLEEITNVVIEVMHNNDELLWPTSRKESKKLNISIKIKLDPEYYEELKELEKGSIPS